MDNPYATHRNAGQSYSTCFSNGFDMDLHKMNRVKHRLIRT